jgi:diguanylate cyclase
MTGFWIGLGAGAFLAAATAIACRARESRIRAARADETSRRLEAEIAEHRLAEEKIRLILELSHSAFVSIDEQSRITNWNRQAETIFGISRENALGRRLTDTIIPPRYRDQHVRGLERFLAAGEGPVINRRTEMTALRHDGQEFPVELTIWPVKWMGSHTFNAFINDITDRKRAEEQLKTIALHDELTGLYNRRGFLTMAQDRLKQAGRDGKSLVIFFADVDGLKRINDTLGHDAGDATLSTAAEVLRDAFRATDVIGRIGGDEFAVLAAVRSLTALPIIEDRLRRKATAKHPFGENTDMPFRISFGHTLVDPSCEDGLDHALKRADAAMYAERQRQAETESRKPF